MTTPGQLVVPSRGRFIEIVDQIYKYPELYYFPKKGHHVDDDDDNDDGATK